MLVRHAAIGLNFLDTYYRSGLYPAPNGLPLIPGGEAAGKVVEVGEGVDWLKPGDRIAYTTPLGAYAEERVIAADRLVKVPDGVSDEQAAAMMLKGMTAQYLLQRTFKVKAGDTILCHAAAGGVGLILGQWAKHLGATTIGTAGSPDKVELARAHGFDHVINYREQDFVAEVKRITGGKLCDVVYDSVGKDTYHGLARLPEADGHARLLRPVVRADSALRPVAPRPQGLALHHAADALRLHRQARGPGGVCRLALRRRLVRQGQDQDQPALSLKDAAKAHADLESRKTSGTTILIP